MQRIFRRRLVLKLPDDSHSFQACKTFASLAKPVQTLHRNLLFSPSINHPVHSHWRSWESRHRFADRVYGFLSTPEIAKQFSMGSSNTLLRASRKNIADFRVCLLRAKMAWQRFQFNPRFENYSRGWRSWFRRLTTNDMVLGLIITNVAVFMLWRIADYRFMSKNFMISLENVKSGRVHTLITSAFSHIDIGHIISNMIGLYFFGMNIGRVFGPEFLLKLYLAGALGGSVFYLAYNAILASSSKDRYFLGNDPSRAQGLGASGAVNAIMLLDIFLFPKSTLYLEFFIPVPAILLGIFLVGKDLLRILEKDSHISGAAHLGGAVVAALAWTRLRRGRF